MSDLKILSSHPVQYHVPFFRAMLAQGIDIDVAYYHQGCAGRASHDDGFGMDIAWDIDLLSGYHYQIFARGIATYQFAEQLKIAPKLLFWALHDRKIPLLLMGWFTEIAWLVWLFRIIRQAPTIVMSETTPLSFAATQKPAWRIALLRWLLQHTAANLYIGSRNRAFLSEMGVAEERLFHVPYSIDNIRFATEVERLLSERHHLCQHYGLDPDKPVFLFCGKLIPKKRPIQLLEAYLDAGLAEQAQLLYVGEGELRPELEGRIRKLGLKNVHLLGFLNQSEMPLAYVLGELLCLISDANETWGLVVNEALACGRPVIVSDTVGCSQDLVNADSGWVVPLDNPKILSQMLRQAFGQYGSWSKMGEMGKSRVATNSFNRMARGVIMSLQEYNHPVMKKRRV